MKRIIFLFSEKPMKRDYIRYGFKLLINKKYKVEAWECPYNYPYNYKDNYFPKDPIEFEGHMIFNSSSAFNNAIMRLEKTDIIIDLNWNNINNLYLSNKCKTVILNLGQITNPYSRKIDKLIYAIKKLINNPLGKISRFNRNRGSDSKRSYDYIIVGGELDHQLHKDKISTNTHIINAHAFDYDSYLYFEKKDKNNSNKIQPYALFIDEDVPNGSDFILQNIKPPVTPDNYYDDLNRFFNEFEKSTGLEIIIGKHPRAIYSKNPYGDRKIVENGIVSLVKYSNVVISHMSTALNFAIVYYKPIILLDSKKYNHFLRSQIRSNKKLFDAKLFDLSKAKINNIKWNLVDKEKYDSYKHKFIKKLDSPNNYIWEIFHEHLQNESKNY